MTDERYNFLMGNRDAVLTVEELADGWHWCLEFDGLLRNNKEEEFQCDCYKTESEPPIA